MLTARKIYKQINTLTAELIQTGLCDAQNFPSINRYSGNIEEVGISTSDHSIFLKSLPYTEMFIKLNENRMYNIKMIDGALISFFYRFKNRELISHRLSFFPSPDLESFQNEPELYFGDDLYIDILDKRIVTVPIRFDFNSDEAVFEPITHPISHLTLGQYENCRVPVAAALTPYQFLSFIIINFYHTAHTKYNSQFSICKDSFEETIFNEERAMLHMQTPIHRA